MNANERKDIVREVLLEEANNSFQYGELDCCLFPAKVAKKVTGKDFASNFHHTNEEEALKYIEQYGGLSSLVSETLGKPPAFDVSELQVGDPVLVSIPIIGEILGIYMGTHAIVKTERGTLQIELKHVVEGWKLDG